MPSVTYIANTLTEHTLFSIDLPAEKTLDLSVSQATETDVHTSIVHVFNDGITIGETQYGSTISDVEPDEITTTVNNHVGYVTVTPSAVPSTFTIDYTVVEPTLYGEHTQSGRLIKGEEGFAIVFGSSNNVIVREANNNVFGSSDDYITSGVLGPVVTGEEFYDSNNLLSFAASQIVANDDFLVVESSGQTRSSHYIEVPVVAGENYRLTANALYTHANVYVKDVVPVQHATPLITVGTTPAASDVLRQQLTEDSETQYNLDFVPSTNTVFVSFGHGSFGTRAAARDISIKNLVPLHTYEQKQGTIYLAWDSVAAGTTLATLGNNVIQVNGSNNVVINTTDCGAQATSNKLAFSYLDGDFVYSLNGAAVQSSNTYYANVTTFDFNTTPVAVSYTSEQVSNTGIIELTDG